MHDEQGEDTSKDIGGANGDHTNGGDRNENSENPDVGKNKSIDVHGDIDNNGSATRYEDANDDNDSNSKLLLHLSTHIDPLGSKVNQAGRFSHQSLEAVKAEFSEMDKVVASLCATTKKTPCRIIEMYSKYSAEGMKNRAPNLWNIYCRYFKSEANRVKELKRLAEHEGSHPILEDVETESIPDNGEWREFFGLPY